MPRFMVMVRANAKTESGALPDEQILKDMGNFNEELIKAGVMLAGEGLHPSANAARVRFDGGGKKTVIDGPFTEAKELIAGYWLWQVRSKEEAVEWVKRAPFEAGDVIEIRQVYETEEFAASDPSGEIRAQEHAQRAKMEKK
jgi:hypothetical protein